MVDIIKLLAPFHRQLPLLLSDPSTFHHLPHECVYAVCHRPKELVVLLDTQKDFGATEMEVGRDRLVLIQDGRRWWRGEAISKGNCAGKTVQKAELAGDACQEGKPVDTVLGFLSA